MKIPIKIRYIASSIITLCRLMETIVKALLANIIFKFMIYISKNNGTKFAIIHIEINRGGEQMNLLQNLLLPIIKTMGQAESATASLFWAWARRQ